MSAVVKPSVNAESKRQPPEFFFTIQKRSSNRWVQLDADPELAGPWRQLFLQVQSPRHVLSELLQNADDAGARRVSVDVSDHVFTLEHDGADFTESDFASLCRFGFSNKRTLHTIGFRGIGFKSTFSLGECVEVVTPSLACRFLKERFTLPLWIHDAAPTQRTVIRVRIQDEDRENELRKNLDEWSFSTPSLLFFRNINGLRIGKHFVASMSLRPGPVPGSEWIHLQGGEEQELLSIRSSEEPFPQEAIDEIRRERNVPDLDLPPCHVEIVFGLSNPQRLFVVLPTGVRPSLPFSCNAPFLQNPDRVAIKDPALSPTNRWLLHRLGELAADSMQTWLKNANLSIGERAKAYDLLPRHKSDANDIEGYCEKVIRTPFKEMGKRSPVLLTADGELANANGCLSPPLALYDVWDSSQLQGIFGSQSQPLLARDVAGKQRESLSAWEWLTPLPVTTVVTRLTKGEPPPRPYSLSHVLPLWDYMQRAVRNVWALQNAMMVPIEGGDRLFSAASVVRMAAGKGLVRDDDVQFLSSFVHSVDRNWVALLMNGPNDTLPKEFVQTAKDVLKDLDLVNRSSWEKVMAAAIAELTSRSSSFELSDVVRLTQIAATLNVRVAEKFGYVTRDGVFRRVNEDIAHGGDGSLEANLSEEWMDRHLLHQAYTSKFISCTRGQWQDWIQSEKSGLLAFTILQATSQPITREKFVAFLKSRQVAHRTNYPLKSSFEIHDHDFDTTLWAHWEKLATSEPTNWCRVVQLVLESDKRLWSERCHCKVTLQGFSYAKEAKTEPIPAKWIVRLRSLACLPDTYGKPRQPAELLMRTPDTEALLGVDAFVRAEFDTDASKPLLRLLGVRDTPAGLDKLLGRIRDLATLEKPLPHLNELIKWYNTLDRVIPRCSTTDLETAQAAFNSARLILTDTGEWASSSEVFQQADEFEVPGIPIVHAAVRQLAMWSRLGVADRPTVDRILGWLQHLEPNSRLDGTTLQRVRAALKQFPLQIWNTCRHWLTLENTWSSLDSIRFRLTMRGLVKWADFFPAVKVHTGNFQVLSAEICDQQPFSVVPDLGSVVEYRPTKIDSEELEPQPKPWLLALADGLLQVNLPTTDETNHVHEVAHRLSQSCWQPCRQIEVTPFIEGTPAGLPHAREVLWHGKTFYVRHGRVVKVFNAVIDELARAFANERVAEAIRACIERDVTFVNEYLEEHFEVVTSKVAIPIDQPAALPEKNAEGQVDHDESVAHPGLLDDAPDGHEQPADTSEPEPDDPDGTTDELERQIRQRTQRRKPPLMSRFVSACGFHWNAARSLFVRQDGTCIAKCKGLFHWEHYDVQGNLVRRYWVHEQCLDQRGMEIPAELWEVFRHNPQENAILVQGDNDEPLEISGGQLLEMHEKGQIMLFPAKYRIRKAANG